MTWTERCSKHLKDMMLPYVIITIIFAIVLGNAIPSISKIPKETYSHLVIALAIATILPSMISIRIEKLLEASRMLKETALAITYAYVIGPLLASITSFALSDPKLRLGYFISMLVPISSASLGYVMMARGNVELAAVALVILSILSFPLVPFYIELYGASESVIVPLDVVVQTIVIVLLVPLIVGQVIRYVVVRDKGSDYVDTEIQPHLSIVTMVSLLALVFLLVLKESHTIVSDPELVIFVLILQCMTLASTILISLILDRVLKVRYEDHQALALVSITKNKSVPAAIVVSSVGGLAMLPPALLPLTQPILVIAYLRMSNIIRKLFEF